MLAPLPNRYYYAYTALYFFKSMFMASAPVLVLH